MDKILEEFEEKFNHIPNRGFIVGKKGGYYDNCAYNIADVSSWLKEKLTALEKTTKIEFLTKILPDEEFDGDGDDLFRGFNTCREDIIKNAEKDGVTLNPPQQ
jgi:hypothetical protein